MKRRDFNQLMLIAPDFPRVRASHVCPICAVHKDTGLLVCWPCYRLFELRHGMSDRVSGQVVQAEASLALAAS